METNKTVRIYWENLIRMLPVLLDKEGGSILFGIDPDDSDAMCFYITRMNVAGRECWLVAEDAEDSKAFLMQCSKSTSGYVDDIKTFLEDAWCVGWNDPVWVSGEIDNANGNLYRIVKEVPGQEPETCRSFAGTTLDALTTLRDEAFDRANSGHYGDYPLEMEAFNAKVEEGFSDNGMSWVSDNGIVLKVVTV